MRLLLGWLISAGALALTIYVLQLLRLGKWTGGEGVEAVVMALFAVLIMAIVNAVIRPIVKLLTMPLTCATLGLFSLLINAAMFWLVSPITQAIAGRPAFQVGFWGAVLGAIVMSVVSGIASTVLIAPEERGS